MSRRKAPKEDQHGATLDAPISKRPPAIKNPLEEPARGTLLGDRYKIVEKIGEGGMGRIYAAEDQRLGKIVAVKMLPPIFAGRVELQQRFAREARITSQIESEHIVMITDLVVSPPPFYVMELLKGRDLATLIATEGYTPWDERSRDIIIQACSALAAAHEKGVVHRDMKPENVFLVERRDGKEYVKILDFRIARLLQNGGEDGQEGAPAAEAITGLAPHKTNADSLLGTPFYMAPEQVPGRELDHRADIYATGIIMYEMLTGTVPFDIPGRSAMDMATALRILDMHDSQEPEPPRQRRPDAAIPEELEAVILRALRKSPSERFADMMEMAKAVERISAPKYVPRKKVALDKSEGGERAREGLCRIRREDEARTRRAGRMRNMLIAGALIITAAAAASGWSLSGMHGIFSQREAPDAGTDAPQDASTGGR